jgi:hypothetical protein
VIEGEDKVPLTAEEIGLLKEIVRWRRSHDVSFYLTRGKNTFAGPYGFMEWARFSDAPDGGPRVRSSVAIDRDEPDRVGEARDYRYGTYSYHRVASVTQAVDLLVALGYLPARFSTAYRAGWDARADATDADGCLDLITWPELAPVVEPTW